MKYKIYFESESNLREIEWDEIFSHKDSLEYRIRGWLWEVYANGGWDWMEESPEKIYTKDENGNIRTFEFQAENQLEFFVEEEY